MSLLTEVNKKVSESGIEQIPEIKSRLTKPVHFKQTQKLEEDKGPSKAKRPREDGPSHEDFQEKVSIKP